MGQPSSTSAPAGVGPAQQLARDLHTARNPRRWTGPLLHDLVRTVGPAVRGVRALPVVELALHAGGAGADLRAHLAARQGGVPTSRAVSVLELPAEPAAYLRGRKKQALRTNCTRAVALGVRTEPVDDGAVRVHAARLLAEGTTIKDLPHLLAEREGPGFVHRVAVGPDGEVLALARVQRDGAVAWLKYLVAVTDRDESVARYLLSAELFADLAARGVRHVVVGSAVLLTPGLVHFQRLLGFEAVHVRVVPPGVTDPSPRAARRSVRPGRTRRTLEP